MPGLKRPAAAKQGQDGAAKRPAMKRPAAVDPDVFPESGSEHDRTGQVFTKCEFS